MKNRSKNALQLLALAAALGAASGAGAQAQGQWYVKAGLNKITPKVSGGNISAPVLPDTRSDVLPDTQPIVNIGRMLTDNISAELDLGLPYEHELVGDGAIAGTGKLGTVQVLPPTAFVQYRFFQPASLVRPYVGLGLTYSYFRKETGSGSLTAILDVGGPPTTFKLKSKWAASYQIGASVKLAERWAADVSVVKSKLSTKATFSTGQYMSSKLDPLAVSLGVVYTF
ncbi:outer membrane beta-barrel protein [Pseudoduganella sp. LjRoot289]|uniref:OmpW/AlkL family protein n=1 Tax=Pseudoduganella sp. LjRoot289 TaxID=3342314 RepID=UPI003ED005A6